MTTTDRERVEQIIAGMRSYFGPPTGGNAARYVHESCDAIQAALTREQREGVCPKCNGAGGERWHEADGSENGQRCEACDGFGTQQEAPGAVAWSVFDKRSGRHWYTHDSRTTAQGYADLYSHKEADGSPSQIVTPLYAATPPAPVDVRKLLSVVARMESYATDQENDPILIPPSRIRSWASDIRALLDGQPAGADHVASRDCWCEPTQDTEEPSVYIHRSKDDGH